MAIRWQEFLANIERYKKALPPDEPIVLPRREAKRRAANKEKRHKIQWDTDSESYAAFHLQRERILMALGENNTLFSTWIVKVMESWSDEMLKRWIDSHEENDPAS
jgi:hypothetical protein